MFFNTKKKQAEKLLNKQAKELADAILNTFKVGLFKTKYHPIDGKFTLPPTIFKDIYISGFIEHFISLNLSYIYNKDNRWTHDEIGEFVVNVYKNLNFTTEDMQLYTNLIIDENIKKDWNIDGRYTLGKEHARLCFCCMLNIFADNDNSKLLVKAKKIAKDMPSILGDETYEIKLISAMCELTIYDYLRKQFGGVLIGRYDFIDDNEEENTRVDNDKSKKDLPINERLETAEDRVLQRLKEQREFKKKKLEAETNKNTNQQEQAETNTHMPFKEFKKRVLRNLRAFYDIEIDLTKKLDIDDFNYVLHEVYDKNLNSIAGAIIVVSELCGGGELFRLKFRLNLVFEYDHLIRIFNKSKILIEEFNIQTQNFPKNENFSYFNAYDFISYINEQIEIVKEAIEEDEKEKYASENILTKIFELHRNLILCAKNTTKDEKKSKTRGNYWLGYLFTGSGKLRKLFNKLEKHKNEDYTHNVKELLLLEESITKVMQQKLYDEIKNENQVEALNKNNLIKELILKDFTKLKI